MKTYTDDEHRKMLDDLRDTSPTYPHDRFSGRGVVICGGGMKLFTCAWVCINMLRRAGCKLPIQLWHLGRREMTQSQRALVAPLGVETVDALEVREKHPARILNGWELKPYAIMHSRFEEVILLDADNVAIKDPTYLFDSDQYREHRCIFWPDFGRLGKSRKIWQVCGLPYVDEPEFESGQIFVNKAACWKALTVTMHMNEHSDFYYDHVHGDKETFHMGWKVAGKSYAMPDRGIQRLHCTMCQHDFDGERVFQHRNLDKWSLARGANVKVHGFVDEDVCQDYIEQLRREWGEGGGVFPSNDQEREAVTRLVSQRWQYHRIGHDHRPMEFISDGSIGAGKARCELRWNIGTDGDGLILRIMGRDATTAALRWREDEGRWLGAWVSHEKMPTELVPLPVADVRS